VLLDDIFEEVKKSCKTGPQAEALSIDLLEAAEHYAALDEPDDPVWAEYSNRCRQRIKHLKVLGSKLVRPVIMSALKHFSARDFEKLLWVLEVIIVRWQLIGEGRTGTIERQCARLAEQIWKKKVLRREGAVEILKELYISDKEFQDKFALQSGVTNQKSVHLLKSIEEHERSKAKRKTGKELAPDQGLTLEHILPANPSSDWAPVLRNDPTLVQECSTRLGNLCLLTEARNREVGRAGFKAKLPIFRESELLTTLQVATNAGWDRQAIEQRQMWLAGRAVELWRY
jgi:hypothetical protein